MCWLVFGAAGCSDYGLAAPHDNQGCLPEDPDCTTPVDTGNPEDTDTTVVPETCGDESFASEPAAIDESCHIDPHIGSFTPVVEWTKSTWSVDPASNNVMMMPAVASLTDDNADGRIDDKDIPDVIVITYGGFGTLRAVSGDGGAEIWNVDNQALQVTGAVAVGDIDGDGKVEIIAPTTTQLKAFENDGSLKWTSPDLSGHMKGISDAPAIADMNGDGTPEITVGNAILNADGSVRAFGHYGIGASTAVGTTSFAADLAGDGQQELITGNAAYDIDGNVLWYNGKPDGYVAAADFDGDGVGDVVVTGDASVRVQDASGTVLCQASIPGASSGYGGPPTVADFDGDGQPEFGVAANSTYTVFESDCSLVWQKPTQDGSSGNTGSSVFDFEGDGAAEAVYADETRLWVFSGPDGAVKLESDQHSNATWTEYPVIVDVDGDEHAEIIVPNTQYSSPSFTGITVFGDRDNSWQPGRKIWNQHAYSITNVNDDGTIPAHPDQNWLAYNNFRSGDLTAPYGGDWPDLVVTVDDVCTDQAGGGRLFVWGRVGNQGYVDVSPGVVVDLQVRTADGWATWASQAVDAVAAGEIEAGFVFEVPGVDVASVLEVALRVDGGNDDPGLIDECNEVNDEASWTGPIVR